MRHSLISSVLWGELASVMMCICPVRDIVLSMRVRKETDSMLLCRWVVLPMTHPVMTLTAA